MSGKEFHWDHSLELQILISKVLNANSGSDKNTGLAVSSLNQILDIHFKTFNMLFSLAGLPYKRTLNQQEKSRKTMECIYAFSNYLAGQLHLDQWPYLTLKPTEDAWWELNHLPVSSKTGSPQELLEEASFVAEEDDCALSDSFVRSFEDILIPKTGRELLFESYPALFLSEYDLLSAAAEVIDAESRKCFMCNHILHALRKEAGVAFDKDFLTFHLNPDIFVRAGHFVTSMLDSWAIDFVSQTYEIAEQ